MAKIKKDTNLRKAILQAAITGQLISNVEGETKTGKELLDKIIEERNAKLLAQWEEAKKKNPKAKKPAPIVPSEITKDEIPFEIPENWCWCRLGELGLYRKGPFGSSLTKSMFVPRSEFSVKVYEQKNAIQKDFTLGDYYIPKEKFDSMQSFIVEPEDIIISCAGTIGEVYKLPQNAPIGIINQALMRVKLYNDELSAFWMLYFDYVLKKEASKQSSGTAIKNIPPFEILKAYPFPLPPLAVQNAIVVKLEEVLPLVDAYENAVLQKEELKTALPDKVKKAILQEAIQGKLTKSWRKTATIEESGKQLLDKIIEERNAKLLAQWEETKKKNPKAKKPAPIAASEITEDEIPFEIPKSWCWCRLGEICKLTDGEKIQDIKLPLLDAKYLRGKKEAEYLSSGKLAKPNDLLILVDGENSGEVFINKEEGIMGSTFKKLNIVNELYLPYVLQFIALNKDLLRNSKKGAAIPHLNKDIFFGLLLPLPPLAEQEKIVEIIEQMLPLCEKLEIKENTNDK
ncbi:type I restriction/modification system, S subunit [Campylobacter lanienae NCTC 13004]|uniref:Type I restriction/modification system, S subunit n=1 Tax=Campylobacter lanienae NCTC 13004 TaxID=1031753 RepID=A0A1X9SMU6_9BACT|nr:restriction endonuclease subunit S [Campylobacter lanienae]ARQ97540.1 type I restriction/modification system, S subunit [Campylobacter lanienae NCTC 13004]